MREEVSQIAEDLADETYKLVSNKLRAIEILDNRLKRIESRLVQHVGDFETDIVEVERMITETRESISKEQDESITILVGEIQELRDEINALKAELKGLRR